MAVSKTRIKGFGAYLPEKILSNADLETLVETNDEWITQRTGIHERHIAREDEFSSDMAIKAVVDLIERNQVSVDDVDQIIVTSFTPDHFTPTVSGLVQGHFGMEHAGSYDLNAGCTGFAYALSVADALITVGHCKKVLVVAAESISKVVDYSDRATCILFGDAAAACLLEYSDEPGSFLGRYFHTDGELAQYVSCGNQSDTVKGMKLKGRNVFDQNGQQVYKYVMQQVPDGISRLLESVNLGFEDIDYFVPHSANMRMIQAVCSRLAFPEEKVLTSLEYCGNTSSASIPLALWLAQKEGRLLSGQTLLLYGFGGGLTHGGVVVRL